MNPATTTIAIAVLVFLGVTLFGLFQYKAHNRKWGLKLVAWSAVLLLLAGLWSETRSPMALVVVGGAIILAGLAGMIGARLEFAQRGRNALRIATFCAVFAVIGAFAGETWGPSLLAVTAGAFPVAVAASAVGGRKGLCSDAQSVLQAVVLSAIFAAVAGTTWMRFSYCWEYEKLWPRGGNHNRGLYWPDEVYCTRTAKGGKLERGRSYIYDHGEEAGPWYQKGFRPGGRLHFYSITGLAAFGISLYYLGVRLTLWRLSKGQFHDDEELVPGVDGTS